MTIQRQTSATTITHRRDRAAGSALTTDAIESGAVMALCFAAIALRSDCCAAMGLGCQNWTPRSRSRGVGSGGNSKLSAGLLITIPVWGGCGNDGMSTVQEVSGSYLVALSRKVMSTLVPILVSFCIRYSGNAVSRGCRARHRRQSTCRSHSSSSYADVRSFGLALALLGWYSLLSRAACKSVFEPRVDIGDRRRTSE
jgi:hypothetical protein